MRLRGGYQVSAETRGNGAELVGAILRFRGQSFRVDVGVALALADADENADLREIIAEAEQAEYADLPEPEPLPVIEGSFEIPDSWRDRKREARAVRFMGSIPPEEWDRVWTPDFANWQAPERPRRYIETPGQARAAVARAERNGDHAKAERLRRTIEKLGW